MIGLSLKKEGEVVNYFRIDKRRGQIVAPTGSGNTHILDVVSFSPDFDTLVFSKDDLEAYRQDWEAGEKNHWNEDTAKERLENQYVKPVLRAIPTEVDWEWG